jgi:uncharacterized protein YciI
MQHFVIEITYRVENAALAAHMEAHVAHLKQGAAQGTVLAFGGKPNGTGGIVVLRCASEAEAQAFMAADPFVALSLVEITCTAFNDSFWQAVPAS